MSAHTGSGFASLVFRFLAPYAFSTLSLAASGCVALNTGDEDGGASGSASGASGTATTAATPSGTNCSEDPSGQVALCQGISICPGVTVDPGAYPNCGFRIDGTALDVECECSDALCPLGTPKTCADVAQLLAAQSGFAVCGQVAEGRCVSLGGVDAGAASSCTSACQAECAGVPDCLVSCGC
jgi:hypothetical protein